jgi:hypothetical protein
MNNTRHMLRLASLALVLATGCLYEEGRTPGPDAGTHIDPSQCEPHTATIFEPADGAIVPRPATFRVRWNEGGIPDRYMSMEDDFGNFFISEGAETVNGDGSISSVYDLPAGGHFNFEIGWFCDAANDGPTIPLAKIRIATSD